MKLGDHDYLLREGRVQELVSTILLKIKGYSFEYIVAVFHQIRIRQQLKLAISNLERFELVNLFQFLTNNIGNKQFFDILYDVIVVTLGFVLCLKGILGGFTVWTRNGPG